MIDQAEINEVKNVDSSYMKVELKPIFPIHVTLNKSQLKNQTTERSIGFEDDMILSSRMTEK